MKILFVCPKFQTDVYSYKYALNFISKKSASPPLGLLTVAAMLPIEWEKKLIDMEITKLDDEDIRWADFVFVTAMATQDKYVKEIISRCKQIGTKIVGGGPLFTAFSEKYEDIDHLILNEAEITLPLFLEDLKNNRLKHIYRTDQFADITKTPTPQWELIDPNNYSTLGIQYSRGCPFDCEFCEQSLLFGRKTRTKSQEQIIAELDKLHSLGCKGLVFFVDDNLVGNKEEFKKNILPAMIQFRNKNKSPFRFLAQVPISISDDEDLLKLMANAGFDAFFIGIETPNESSLTECSKNQNRNRDLLACIRKIQGHGIEIQAGFILGFDNDPETIFEDLIKFIQESGIVTAMIHILKAPRGTKLYNRLKSENRLLNEVFRTAQTYNTNFITVMDHEKLMNGYKKVVSSIYSPRQLYKRIENLLQALNRNENSIKIDSGSRFQLMLIFIKILFKFGLLEKTRFLFWKLFFSILFKCPKNFPIALTLVVTGYNYRKTFEENIKTFI